MSADCCTYECNQGRDCPVRSTPTTQVLPVLPTTSRARKYTCQDLGVCNNLYATNCTSCGSCTDVQQPAPQAIAQPTAQPTEEQDAPLSTWEAIFLYGAIGTSGLMTIVAVGGGLGWLYQRFAG